MEQYLDNDVNYVDVLTDSEVLTISNINIRPNKQFDSGINGCKNWNYGKYLFLFILCLLVRDKHMYFLKMNARTEPNHFFKSLNSFLSISSQGRTSSES